jgi:hypothetical protein
MSTSCRCGAAWSGLRIEHCMSCHETFSGTSAGDLHRVGEHGVKEGPDRRRCLTVAEMKNLTFTGGKREGEPRFSWRVNPRGTTIWGLSVALGTAWEHAPSSGDGSTGAPVCDCPGTASQAVYGEPSAVA